MLASLAIRDFLTIASLDLEFSPGFSAFTGETGAGKSITMDALLLILGAKPQAQVVRPGAKHAEVAAIFEGEEVARMCRAKGMEIEEDVLVLRRLVGVSGKSRSFVNGVPASAAEMGLLAAHFLAIAGQNSHDRLLRRDEPRLLLDAFAKAQGLAREVRRLLAEISSRQEELLLLRDKKTRAMARRSFLEEAIQDFCSLDVSESEWAEVEAEHKASLHAQSLAEGVGGACRALTEEEPSVLARVFPMVLEMQRLKALDPALGEIAELLQSGAQVLQEAGHAMRAYLKHRRFDEERLAWLGAQVAEVMRLSRKHLVSREKLWDLRRCFEDELSSLKDIEQEEALLLRLRDLENEAKKAISDLSAARKEAAPKLEAKVNRVLEVLGFWPKAFSVRLAPLAAPLPGGAETVEFFLEANQGLGAKPLAQAASGGELSRVHLAVSLALQEGRSEEMTLVFDEIDAGLGGRMAHTLGSFLRALGRGGQVFAVTHAPQVAAQAHHHFLVFKDKGLFPPVTRIENLSAQGRIGEIARMLGGARVEEVTLMQARAMLEDAFSGTPEGA